MRARALGERSFRLLFIGQGVSSIGDGVAPIALSFAVLGLTGSISDLGVILAARQLPLIVFVLIGGVWSDRLSRQAVMLFSDLARAGAQVASAVLLLSGSAHIWELACLQAVYGFAKAFFGPASTGLLPQTVKPGQLQQANAFMGMSENIASILGPALGGVLVVVAGAGWGLAFDGGAFVVSAISLRMMRLAPIAFPPRRSATAELREGWQSFRSRRWLSVSVASLTFIVTIVFAPLAVLGPEVARAHLGGAGAWAAISTALGVGSIAGGAFGLRWKPRHPVRAGFLVTLAGEPILLALLGAGGPLLAIVAFAVLSGAAATIFNVFWFTLLQSEIPADELSRVSSWDYLGTYALQPIGLAVVGPIAIAVGVSTLLYAAGALAALTTCTVLAVPAVRNFAPASSATAPVAFDAAE